MKAKESAKFFAGFAASHALTDGALAVSGAKFEMLGIGFTRELGFTAAIVWAILFLVLFHYAWLRNSGAGQG